MPPSIVSATGLAGSEGTDAVALYERLRKSGALVRGLDGEKPLMEA